MILELKKLLTLKAISKRSDQEVLKLQAYTDKIKLLETNTI